MSMLRQMVHCLREAGASAERWVWGSWDRIVGKDDPEKRRAAPIIILLLCVWSVWVPEHACMGYVV